MRRFPRFAAACRSAFAAATLIAAATVMTTPAIAGEYEDAMATIEAKYGPVGDINTGDPGSVSWLVMDMALEAKQLKSEGRDDEAAEKAAKAAALAQSSQ